MKTRFNFLNAAILILLFSGCRDAFEYSPNQIYDDDSEVGLNLTNLHRLDTLPADDTITIAFVGDSQRFYDEIETFIDTANAIPSIDFVLLAGDITDFGLLQEFELVHEKFQRLNKPYFGVVGNHDVVSKGSEVFERMFGPLDFSFVYNRVKFVLHNTNGKEFTSGNVPDMAWLRTELASDPAIDYFVAVSHIPPYSIDFDKKLEGAYVNLFRETPSFLVSLHGHIHEHTDGYPYNDGIRYITSYSFDQRSFVLLKISGGEIYKQLIAY
jgi:3',5'-cyclic AMP phosphodiesterase CpdA